MKKRKFALILGIVVLMGALTGCGNKGAENQGSTTAGGNDANATTGAISVISREDGSGTRGAFIELFGIEEKDADGNKIDNTTAAAEITNSTSVMMTTVAGNESAIGYISLGSLNNTVKALKIDGVEASVENVSNESYKISRPFNIATKKDLSDAANDFITYIMSAEGQAIVEQEKYISVGDKPAYQASGVSGKITISGSSSVTPVMEKLKEAYCALNKDVTIELQQSDSSTGMIDAMNGVSDIGMASRELKDEEAAELQATVIAKDGIAVIVNNDNTFDELSSEQVKAIFTGDTTDWSELK